MPTKSGGKNLVNKTTKKKSVAKKTVKKVTKKTTKKKASTVAKKTSKKVLPKGRRKPAKKAERKIDNKLTLNKSKNSDKVKEVALEQLFRKAEPISTNVSTEKKRPEKVVTLPSNMSVRNIEKALAISTLLSPEVAERVRKGAYGLSFAFLLVGALAVGVQIANFSSGSNLVANILSGTSSTESTIDGAIEIVEKPPVFELLGTVPEEISEETAIKFSLSEVDSVEVLLRSVETGKRIFLGTDVLNNDEYLFLIPGAGLEAGKYSIRIIGHTQYRTHDFSAGYFEVTQQEVLVQSTEEQSTEVAQADEVGTESAPSVESTTEENAINKVEEVEVEEVAVTPTEPLFEEGPFSLGISSSNFTEPTMLLIQAPVDIEQLKVYALKNQSYTPIFVGSARKEFSTWRLFFDVTDIPNGDYELYATGIRNEIELESRRRRITVNKPALVTVYSESLRQSVPEDENSESAVATESATTTLSDPTPIRDFSELSLAPDTKQNPETERIVTEVLRDEKTDLEVLLRNYSVASQSGDETSLRLATNALSDFTERLKTSDQLSTDGLDGQLSLRIDTLKERIDTFEKLRRDRNSELTALDSDGDGISDFDERALFNTDPDNPDSDEDGITDGIEILRGFNPKDATSQAVLVYESPKETIGLEQPEDLFVKRVQPYVEVSEDQVTSSVQAVIEGVALPNTYVTLYIFSTPTIVTVKTDDTGAFSYTFSNELEDGTHEVFIAITDNAGDIIAQSASFPFVKEAQAFTAGTVSTAITPTPQSTNTYGIALGLGILSLGLVLLMLGIGLRKEEPQVAVS